MRLLEEEATPRERACAAYPGWGLDGRGILSDTTCSIMRQGNLYRARRPEEGPAERPPGRNARAAHRGGFRKEVWQRRSLDLLAPLASRPADDRPEEPVAPRIRVAGNPSD